MRAKPPNNSKLDQESSLFDVSVLDNLGNSRPDFFYANNSLAAVPKILKFSAKWPVLALVSNLWDQAAPALNIDSKKSPDVDAVERTLNDYISFKYQQ